MKKIFKEIMEASNLVGGSSVVYNKGKIVEKLAYGYSNREKNKKFTCDTAIRIASVSKVIVSLTLMHLYDEGKIDLDLDISEYLGFEVKNPKYPNIPITLRMILAHTSSITDGKEVDAGDNKDTGYNKVNGTNSDFTLKDLLHPEGRYYVHETYSKHKPGTYFQYSNFGCGIIACIIEKVSGQYFTDYVKEVVFKPLDLDASFVVTDLKTKDIASIYKNKNGENVLGRTRDFFANNLYKKFPIGENYRGPAGGCFISTNGLMKLMITLLNGGAPIVKEETLSLMMNIEYSGKREPWDSTTARGLHLGVLDYYEGRRLFGHTGDAYGVKTHFYFNKEEQIGMVFVTNGGGFKYQECGIADMQEKAIRATLEKYWHPEIATTFRFNVKDDFGYLNNRKIFIKTKASEEGIYFAKNSIFDTLGISTWYDYEYFDNEKEYYLLDEVLETFKEKYNFDVQKTDESYMISYKHL